MPKYQISYSYNDGDSFSTREGQESCLELKWNNLDAAKENLRRIKEHYEWYCKMHDFHWKVDKKEIDASKKWASEQSWCIPEKDAPEYHTLKYDFVIYLVDDNFKNYQYSCTTWCGYFESLNWAKIEIAEGEESDMAAYFN